MKALRFTLVGLMTLLVSNAVLAGGTTVGSGGDYLRDLYENARAAAALQIESISPCSFDGTVDSQTADWIIQNQMTFAADIRQSAHMWVVDAQPTCGFTNHSSASPIYLSYPTCSNTTPDLRAAMFVLVHESAHHLGIDNEMKADLIARFILNANPKVSCQSANDIFDPKICQAHTPMTSTIARKFFQQGASDSGVISSPAFHGRIKRCDSLSGCLPWRDWSLEVPAQRIHQGAYYITHVELSLSSASESPYFDANLVMKYGSGPRPEVYNAFTINDGLQSALGLSAFRGERYDGSATTQTQFSPQPPGVVFRSDCMWAGWTSTNVYPKGVTEVTEVVLLGNY
jgi:hypothetical protein